MFGPALFKRNISKVPLYIKNARVLKHFEEVHRYQISNEVQTLRTFIVEELKKPHVAFTSLDIRLCTNFRKITIDELLSLLNSWGSVRPDVLHTTVFYQTFLKLVRNGHWKDYDWNHLVQIIYFIGYLNGNHDSKSLMIHFLHSVNNSLLLQSAHFKDVCIICEASFRTSTGVSSPAIRNQIAHILENLNDEISKNSIWLVMLIKAMIFSKYFDIILLNKIADKWVLSGNLNKIAFTTQCYILALFSNASVRHEKLMVVLVSSIACKMQKNSFRVKDVSMFLWSVSHLSFNLEEYFISETIQPFLMSELNERNLKNGLNILIQCCISLWMLGCFQKALIDQLITMKSFETLKDKNKNYRDLSRFSLLVSILEAEYSASLTSEQKNIKAALKNISLLVPSLENELTKRPELALLCDLVRNAGTRQVRMDYPVPIYVAGVSGMINQHPFHLDLLDKSTCLACSTEPTGRIISKVKLLKLQHPDVKHIWVKIEDLPKLRNEELLKQVLGSHF